MPPARKKARDGITSSAQIDDGTSYLMNREGKLIIPPGQYRNMYCLGEERLYLVQARRGYPGALVYMDGSLLTPFHFRSEGLYSPGNRFREGSLCLLKKQSFRSRCGCITLSGEDLIPFEHEYFVDGFVDGVGTITLNAPKRGGA